MLRQFSENTNVVQELKMRNSSLSLPLNPQPRRTENWLLDLPTEVRHLIYQYLLCEIATPIWIGQHYKLWPSLTWTEADPIFHTQLFRLSKKTHDDSVRFAYGFNEFELRDDFSSFCWLGSIALRSIRFLTVVQGAWRSETPEEELAWRIIQRKCRALQTLEIVLHADMLIPAIPHLRSLSQQIFSSHPKPTIAVDLHVWDRHFSFDTDTRDYARAREMLLETYTRGPLSPEWISAKARVDRLPEHAQEIILTADVTSGTIRAIDDYLASSKRTFLVKSSRNIVRKGHRSAGGRSSRYCYDLVWQERITGWK